MKPPTQIDIDELRPLIRSIGVLLGCRLTLEHSPENDAFLSALAKVRAESIKVAHVIYDATKLRP